MYIEHRTFHMKFKQNPNLGKLSFFLLKEAKKGQIPFKKFWTPWGNLNYYPFDN